MQRGKAGGIRLESLELRFRLAAHQDGIDRIVKSTCVDHHLSYMNVARLQQERHPALDARKLRYAKGSAVKRAEFGSGSGSGLGSGSGSESGLGYMRLWVPLRMRAHDDILPKQPANPHAYALERPGTLREVLQLYRESLPMCPRERLRPSAAKQARVLRVVCLDARALGAELARLSVEVLDARGDEGDCLGLGACLGLGLAGL